MEAFDISFSEAKVINSSFDDPLKEFSELGGLNHNINISHNSNIENNEVSTLVEVSVETKKDKSRLGVIKVIYNFSLNDKLLEEENKIPDDLVKYLNKLVLGFTRGIMYQEFRGTFLHGSILPIIKEVESNT